MSIEEIRTEEIRTEETRTEEIHTEEIRTEEIHTEEIRTEETFILQRQLEEYVSKGLYPLHMPGHKRRVQPAPGLPCDWDVTEVPGTDDLHDAHGILEEAITKTGACIGPVSMMVIGILIASANLKEVFTNWHSLLICFMRLIAIPLLTILMLWLTRIPYLIDQGPKV